MLRIVLLCFIYIMFNACSSSMFLGYESSNFQKHSILDNKNCDFSNIEEISFSSNNEITSVKDPMYNGNFYAYQSFLCKNYKNSIKLFDLVEDSYKSEDEKNIFLKIGEDLLETIFNENITNYFGQSYEKMLTNTYKAMGYLALKRYDEAGVEIKRALDRQKRNKEEFERRIISNLNSLQYKQKEYNELNLIVKDLEKYNQYNAYKDYSNPFVSYFSALFYILDNRASNSIDLLKEVSLQTNSLLFRQDYELAMNNFNARKIPNKIKKSMQVSKTNKYIWVIYENGKSKSLEEFNLVIPIFYIRNSDDTLGYALAINYPNNYYKLGTGNMSFSIAILGNSKIAYPYLIANNTKTELLSNMDDIIGAEYKATLAIRIAKSFFKAALKTTTSIKANKKNIYAGLGVDLSNALLNHSDIRYFIGLPKDYQATRVANTGNIKILSPNKQILLEQNLDVNKHYLIIFKIPTIGTNYFEIFQER